MPIPTTLPSFETQDEGSQIRSGAAKMIRPGLEPETLSVLDSRDNQLHHRTGQQLLELPVFHDGTTGAHMLRFDVEISRVSCRLSGGDGV